VPDQLAALQGAHADQAYAAISEIEHLQRARVAHQPLDIIGDELLGTHGEVHRDRGIREQLRTPVIVGGADARDLGRRAKQCPGDLAGDHVDFVAAGERDDHVGAGDAGCLEHARVGGVAGNRADVEPVLKVAQHLVAGVHDGDVVRQFTGELMSGRAADLAGAENDDFQGDSCPGGEAACNAWRILAQLSPRHARDPAGFPARKLRQNLRVCSREPRHLVRSGAAAHRAAPATGTRRARA
jgi:hypothetical protein